MLVGREAELHALATALDAAADGAGSVVFLAGEPGIGKSRLAGEASSLASSHGFLVLSGRAVQASAPLPLRPVAEALTGAARAYEFPDAPEMAAYRPVLASMVPAWSQHGGHRAEMSPLILGEAVLRLLTAFSNAAGLLRLEDLQWADPETLAIVEYLADNVAGRRVLCLATLRDSEPSAAQEVIRAVLARRAATVVTVPRLSERDVGRMAAACLKEDSVPDALLGQLLRSCDGLPYAVEEILAGAVASGELVSGEAGWQVHGDIAADVPASIIGSVRRRLAGLGPDVTDVLVSAAVLGRQFDWTLLPSLAEATEPEVLAALKRACDAQLIEPAFPSRDAFRFRHALTRDAILSGLLPPDLALRSARAASAIQAARPGLPGALCELAAQLHEAAGQPGQAAVLLLEAGRRALRQEALASAEASMRKAWGVAQASAAEPRLLADIDEALSKVLTLTGDCSRLVPVAERLLAELEAAGADPARKAVVRLRIARTLSDGNRVASAERHVCAARALADGSPDPALGGQIDAVAARCAIDAGELDRALELACRALTSAETAGLSGWAAGVACEALEVIGRRERVRDLSAARAAFERAYQIAASHQRPVRGIRALLELGTIEMLEDAGSNTLSEAKGLAVESGAISIATVLDLQLACGWSMGVDLDRALAAARQCEEAAGRLRMRRVEAMAVTLQACMLGIRAERQAAERAAERAERIAPGDPEILAATWGEGRATVSMFLDDLPRALEEVTTAVSYARKAPLTAPLMAWGFWPLLVAMSGGDGRGALGEALAAGGDIACWNRGCLAYAAAVLEGRDGHKHRASELAEDGRAQFRPFAPWWNHLVRRIVAPAALEDGWGHPAAWLRDAIPDFENSGHDRLASACRGILRRAGERVPRTGRGAAGVPVQLRRLGVTSREMDVFLLVGQGCPNAEIADRLFISPKTVESHVASLVAKTGRTSRRELVAFTARFATPDISQPRRAAGNDAGLRRH